MSLTPDDNSAESLSLATEKNTGKYTAPTTPYLLAAVLSGLLMLFILRGITLMSTTVLTSLVISGTALFTGITVYSLLQLFQFKISLALLSVVAAELGMIYSLPANNVYLLLFRPSPASALAFGWMLLAGLAGLVLAFALQVEKRPNLVLLVIMLASFVTASFVTMAH